VKSVAKDTYAPSKESWPRGGSGKLSGCVCVQSTYIVRQTIYRHIQSALQCLVICCSNHLCLPSSTVSVNNVVAGAEGDSYEYATPQPDPAVLVIWWGNGRVGSHTRTHTSPSTPRHNSQTHTHPAGCRIRSGERMVTLGCACVIATAVLAPGGRSDTTNPNGSCQGRVRKLPNLEPPSRLCASRRRHLDHSHPLDTSMRN
jgi:hypothetical protein